jgi:hypothetical protein
MRRLCPICGCCAKNKLKYRKPERDEKERMEKDGEEI